MATHSGSCLEYPMDRGDWWAIVHRVAKSQTWLKRLNTHTHTYTHTHTHWISNEGIESTAFIEHTWLWTALLIESSMGLMLLSTHCRGPYEEIICLFQDHFLKAKPYFLLVFKASLLIYLTILSYKVFKYTYIEGGTLFFNPIISSPNNFCLKTYIF